MRGRMPSGGQDGCRSQLPEWRPPDRVLSPAMPRRCREPPRRSAISRGHGVRFRQPCGETGQPVVLHDWGVGLMGTSPPVSRDNPGSLPVHVSNSGPVTITPLTSGQENGNWQFQSCIAPYEQVYLSVNLDGPTSDPLVRALPFRCGMCVNTPMTLPSAI